MTIKTNIQRNVSYAVVLYKNDEKTITTDCYLYEDLIMTCSGDHWSLVPDLAVYWPKRQ